MKDYSKLKISLEGQLIGMGFHRALRALNVAKKFHVNKRKDGSPEFQHQTEMMLNIICLPDLNNLEEVLVVAGLHDIAEDYDITTGDIAHDEDFNFGLDTAQRVFGMSKVYRGIKRDSKEVWNGMAKCPIISIVKGVDRMHNHGTMAGGFKLEKIPVYLDETENDILPMLKLARKRFPHQSRAYYMIENVLHRDIYMLRTLMARFQQPQS